MKAFDFDNTLYRGESSLDFSLYMIRTHKKILLYLPVIMVNTISYKLCLVDREKLGESINNYMKLIIRDKREIRRLVRKFSCWTGSGTASARKISSAPWSISTGRRSFTSTSRTTKSKDSENCTATPQLTPSTQIPITTAP